MEHRSGNEHGRSEASKPLRDRNARRRRNALFLPTSFERAKEVGRGAGRSARMERVQTRLYLKLGVSPPNDDLLFLLAQKE
jgi:hypothetical protein